MTDFESAVTGLSGLRVFGAASAKAHGLPDPYERWLRRSNGGVAFDGALRFFPAVSEEGLRDIAFWNSEAGWKSVYGPLSPSGLLIFAEDGFGVQFGFLPNERVARFWNETAEVEPLDMDAIEFVEAIAADPNGTISRDLFGEASRLLGRLALSEHFAFRVETALGGTPTADNLQKMDAVEHMRASAKIARQIAHLPLGTRIERVERE